jgi:hypothetical protein
VGEDEEKKGRPFEKRSWKPSRSPALVDASSTQFSVVDSHHHHMYTHERKKRREEREKGTLGPRATGLISSKNLYIHDASRPTERKKERKIPK